MALIVFIVGLQSVTQKSALVTVPLVSFTGPLLLALTFSRLNVYRNRLKTYFTTSLPDSYGELILFTAFGFFGFALGLSDSKQYILPAIQYLGFDAPITLIPLITALAALPCLFGIHPIVTISTIAITLPPGSMPKRNSRFAPAPKGPRKRKKYAHACALCSWRRTQYAWRFGGSTIVVLPERSLPRIVLIYQKV